MLGPRLEPERQKGEKGKVNQPILEGILWSVIFHVFYGASFLGTLSPFGAQGFGE